MPMTGFEPRTYGIGNDRSTNWATQPLPLPRMLTVEPYLTFLLKSPGAKDHRRMQQMLSQALYLSTFCFCLIIFFELKSSTLFDHSFIELNSVAK